MLGNHKAQAILELAVLGAIIISAFSIAISQSESAWRSLAIRQKAFRQAQQAAFAANSAASKSLTSYPRMPNIITPMELGELQQFSGSGSVLWSDGKNTGGESSGDSSAAPYNTTVTSGSGAKITANYTTTFKKEEKNGKIVTTRTLDVEEDNGRIIHRSRVMQ